MSNPFDEQDPPYTADDEVWEFGETLTVTEFLRDEGTIVLFGTDDDRVIAVDHRPAQGLVALLEDLGEVVVFAADFQILGSPWKPLESLGRGRAES